MPMAILIAMYGRKDGPRAALKFFLFTFIPSAPLLVAILWLYARTGSFDLSTLQTLIAHGNFPADQMCWVALAFLFAFAVKVPVFPLHGWLADTFSEAPVALAMVVAGKLGLYSMLRFHIGLFPTQARAVAPVLVGLAVVGILYGACLALVQRDFWRLMAFAALSHLSLITLGIYGLTLTGWEGAVYQILNHGVVDGALFLLLGVLYDRYRTSEINAYGGLAAKLPRTATFFVIASLAMIGLPMLSGFVGEFLILLGTFTGVSKGWAIAATLGVILGAAYMLWLVQRLFFGPESALAASKPPEDLRLWRTGRAGAAGRADAGDGSGADAVAADRSKMARTFQGQMPSSAAQFVPLYSRDANCVQWGGPAVNPVPDIFRILPEVILTLTGVLVMLLDASLPPAGRAVGWAGSPPSAPHSPCGPAFGSFRCLKEPASPARSRRAPSPSSSMC